jgi:hypothetical protein
MFPFHQAVKVPPLTFFNVIPPALIALGYQQRSFYLTQRGKNRL